MKHPPPIKAIGRPISRIHDVAAHTGRYSFHAAARLARDTGLDRTTVWRILHGTHMPNAFMLARITAAFERELGYRIDPRDLVAEDGLFPTRYACDLIGDCRGCLPDNATDEFGDTKKAFHGIEPGKWVTSRYPRGYEVTAEGGNDAK